MKYDVLNRFSGAVQFTAEIDCANDASVGVRVGLAVKWAVKTNANFADADLADAYLAGANLADADLAGANLAGANFADAYLAGANCVIDAGTPNGWRCVGWLRDGWLSVRVGCRDKRLDEGREYWAGEEDRREVLAALDYVKAIAKLRGWETCE